VFDESTHTATETQRAATVADIAKRIEQGMSPVVCTGLGGPERAYLLAALFRELGRPVCVVVPTEREAERLSEETAFFLAGDRSVTFFPSYPNLPFKGISYHSLTAARRIGSLYRMLSHPSPSMVVTSAGSLLETILPRRALSDYAELVITGEELDRDLLVEKLVSGGYTCTVVVEEPGEFSVRGGIVDVFSPGYPDPVRVEFFGDSVESLRFFSATDQRTLKHVREVVLLPATEAILPEENLPRFTHKVREQALSMAMPVTKVRALVERIQQEGRIPGVEGFLPLVYGRQETLTDYLPRGSVTVVVDPESVETEALSSLERAQANFREAREHQRLCISVEETHLQWPHAWQRICEKSVVHLRLFGGPGPFPGREKPSELHFKVSDNTGLRQELTARLDGEELLRPLVNWIRRGQKEGCAVVLVSATPMHARRLEGILAPYGVAPQPMETLGNGTPRGAGVHLMLGDLAAGFVWPAQGLALVTEAELFGHRRRKGRVKTPRPRSEFFDFAELKRGDLVVHQEHGIGRYEGLVKMAVNGATNDFFLLAYRDNDKLYVPVDRTNLVQKYRGVEGSVPVLDKMGGKSWERLRRQVKQSVEKIAGELLKLYATRKVLGGHAFSPVDDYFKGFEEGFEYEETPDQLQAIEDVLTDMEQPAPMDRLVCGDVGYGKTEVALRASFKCVCDGKQVAFLVPTTVLAEQHYQTFLRRFEGYPVHIGCLNRFRSPKEQRAVATGLAEGKIDIVIGTHRLLQKDVRFRDLGLLIIDEEQRFGVRHKERLKKLRSTVEVLALTATPIPRTLHMSLMGARDISVISTPPEQRRAITTFVSPFDDALVAEAIRRELERKGQVFFVHNRVETIRKMAERLEKLVPEVRLGVAHGQLPEEELEQVMMRFVRKEIDLLLCTTIIEAGLDIPSANTILINRADKLGLAQIYQLRGRVGRAEEQAYAYLFIPEESTLTRHAKRRLKVLMEHSDLGAGFQIAMSDLEIRGGGTLLGASQSGHIASVGYEMYMQLMEAAISELKGEKLIPRLEPEINVDFSAYLPEDYIPDTDQRLIAYRRLARLREVAEVARFQEELKDRFGRLPQEAVQLLHKIMLKVLCRKAGVKKLDLTGASLHLALSPEHHGRPEALVEMVSKNPGRLQLTADGLLKVRLGSEGHRARVMETKIVLKEMAPRVSEQKCQEKQRTERARVA